MENDSAKQRHPFRTAGRSQRYANHDTMKEDTSFKQVDIKVRLVGRVVCSVNGLSDVVPVSAMTVWFRSESLFDWRSAR